MISVVISIDILHPNVRRISFTFICTKLSCYIIQLTEQEYQKTNIVTINYLSEGKRMNLPQAVASIKKVQR